jgi:hypothetical protein
MDAVGFELFNIYELKKSKILPRLLKLQRAL